MNIQSQTMAVPFIGRISQKLLFYLLAAILLSVWFLYAFLINKTVMNVVAREKTESTLSALSGSEGNLESKYLALESAITIKEAYQKGFVDASAQFINRSSNVAINSR